MWARCGTITPSRTDPEQTKDGNVLPPSPVGDSPTLVKKLLSQVKSVLLNFFVLGFPPLKTGDNNSTVSTPELM